MARRSDHTREELTALAVAAGQKLLKEGGLSAFSARKVAAEIGYTVGTLYNIFGHYDLLLLHVNAVTLAELKAELEKVPPHKKGKDALEALALRYLEFAEKHYPRWKALFDHTLPAEVPVQEWYLERLAEIFALVEHALMPLVHDDSSRARTESRIVWAGIQGLCMLALTGKLDTVQAGKPRTLIRQFIDTYSLGLSAS